MTDQNDGWRIHRRTVLKSAMSASVAGVVGVPAFSGSALAQSFDELAFSCELDVMCAVDASGSLDGEDVALIEDGVNAFIDRLAANADPGTVRVGSLEFAGGEIRNVKPPQAPGELDVTVSSPGGDTPMPGALDIADQVLYERGRADVDKLIVLFTDGGPNYETKWSDPINYAVTLNGETYTAPRDDTTDWSAVPNNGDPVYDNDQGDTIAEVSEGEMDETKGVAASIKDGSVGDGATEIAAIYTDLADDVTNAMTEVAIGAYTDLPTYLEENISSSSDLFLEGDKAEEIAGLGEELADTIEENCCDECPDGFDYKYEWVEDDEADGECTGEFVVFDDDDTVVESVEGLELVEVDCDGDGEPQTACFETSICELAYEVKAGSGTKAETVTFDETGGEFCVTGIEDTNPAGKTVTYAISNIVFSCPG